MIRLIEANNILDEQVILCEKETQDRDPQQRSLFPAPADPPSTIMHPNPVGRGKKRTIRKVPGRNDNFYSEIETGNSRGGWAPSIRPGPRKSGLANMPDDETRFPVTTWLRGMLINGTQDLMLNNDFTPMGGQQTQSV